MCACVCACVFADDSRPRFGSRRAAVSAGSLLDDQHWHSVHIERFNKQVNLTVDSHTQHFHTAGEGHSLEVDYEVRGWGGRGANARAAVKRLLLLQTQQNAQTSS